MIYQEILEHLLSILIENLDLANQNLLAIRNLKGQFLLSFIIGCF